MNSRRLCTIIALALSLAVDARADVGRRILRGVTFALSPSIGAVQNGPQVDQNVFRQRVFRNIPGDGYGYEFTRVFGTDSYGNIQQLDAGPVNVSLQGQVHNRFVVNQRFIPELQIQSDTGGAGLNYDANIFTGFQNAGLQGQLNSTFVGTINALGFYNIQLSSSNTGNRTIDGFVVTDDQSTDFDVGPINISGNIFLDMGAAASQAFLNQLGALSFAVPSSASARTKEPEITVKPELTDSQIADAEIQRALEEALLRTVLQESFETLLTASLNSSLLPADAATTSSSALSGRLVAPEPTTVALLVAPAALMLLRRRR